MGASIIICGVEVGLKFFLTNGCDIPWSPPPDRFCFSPSRTKFGAKYSHWGGWGALPNPWPWAALGLPFYWTIQICNRLGLTDSAAQARLFLLGTILAAAVWFAVVALLRSRYLDLAGPQCRKGADELF